MSQSINYLRMRCPYPGFRQPRSVTLGQSRCVKMADSQGRAHKRIKRETSTQPDSDTTATLRATRSRRPSSSEEEDTLVHQSLSPSRAYHRVNLYDAVAGRVGAQGLLTIPSFEEGKDTLRAEAEDPIAPEEVLFRTKGAPQRYEEDDIYFAERQVGRDQKLPDSDLLKALHRYAADYYANATADRGESSWKTLDETALLALGVLIEEAAAEAMGTTGYLALLEADNGS